MRIKKRHDEPFDTAGSGMMKLILKRAVPKLGEPGDVVSVKPGYARNYLLPQGLAYEASEANLRKIEAERNEAEERMRKGFLEGKRRASVLEGVSITFSARASEEGRLFGSVSASDIADKLNETSRGFEVERRQVLLDDTIKDLGEHVVLVRLFQDVEVEVQVRVDREGD
jgi:large subunit ribosomal protein L9